MANARQPRGQGMEQKTADELVGFDRHGAGFVGVGGTILFVLEGDLAVRDVQNAAVVDGHTLCVTAQVFQHSLWPAEGRFGIKVPFSDNRRVLHRGRQVPASGKNSPLAVDADGVLADPAAGERLQAVARNHAQIGQDSRSVELIELPLGRMGHAL